jgi:hypothetical protein
MKTALGPPDHEKYCMNISCPGHTGMHYMTNKSHQIQKHKFGTMCPGVLFVESIPVPPKHEK